jgi:hypothetical protein
MAVLAVQAQNQSDKIRPLRISIGDTYSAAKALRETYNRETEAHKKMEAARCNAVTARNKKALSGINPVQLEAGGKRLERMKK